MKKPPLLLLFATFICSSIIAQDNNNFGIRFSGFVKTDIFWDSRQTIDAREGHFLLYPANEKLDAEGEDINATPSFNMLSIQTRLKGTITGPDALGAKTSGVIEGAFFGHSNGDINGFRLRHAFVKLNWSYHDKYGTELLVGQYWHPMFVTSCYPGVVSFNTGAPFQPFSRNPQIRITQKLGKFNIILAAFSQVDFVSTGPDGASEKYIRNSANPASNIRFEFRTINQGKSTEFLIGTSLNSKTLKPRLETETNYKADGYAISLAAAIYSKLKFKPITIKLYGVYAQDGYNLTMIGGYAVKEITDPVKDYRDYIPISTASAWIDVHSNGKKWQLGILGGYAKNMGADEDFVGPTYQRGGDIAYLYRIAPRFIYNSGRFRIAPEIDYTVAAYATRDAEGNLNINSQGEITDSKEIGNLRFLLGVYFFF